jgi:hypothetical protein
MTDEVYDPLPAEPVAKPPQFVLIYTALDELGYSELYGPFPSEKAALEFAIACEDCLDWSMQVKELGDPVEHLKQKAEEKAEDEDDAP